ncbi:MAG: cysteine desulfurase family protein [Vicinamibacterales bacterium]
MRIYLDHNATTPVAPAVAEAVAESLRETYGNPSSIHWFGQKAKAALDAARQSVSALIGAEPAEIVFTSGGTEADNMAIRGAAAAAARSGRRHIVTTAIEHEAVLNTVHALEREGWPVTIVPVSHTAVVSAEVIARAIRADTALISVMHANNEVGTIQPIEEIAALARSHGILVHTDAVQSAGKVPVDARKLGVDLMSISAHKFGGPKGAGALWIRRGVTLMPWATGGRQERNRRPGTENVPAIAGFGVAAALALGELDKEAARMAALRDRLEGEILARIPGTERNGAAAPRVPNTTNISFQGAEAESLLIALDLEGIAVSTGSACSSGTLEPSHVLRGMGLSHQRAQSSLRFSLGKTTTEDEIARVLEVLPAIVEKIRRIGRG